MLEFRGLMKVNKYWNGVEVNGRSVQISQNPACAKALLDLLRDIISRRS